MSKQERPFRADVCYSACRFYRFGQCHDLCVSLLEMYLAAKREAAKERRRPAPKSEPEGAKGGAAHQSRTPFWARWLGIHRNLAPEADGHPSRKGRASSPKQQQQSAARTPSNLHGSDNALMSGALPAPVQKAVSTARRTLSHSIDRDMVLFVTSARCLRHCTGP